MWLGEHNECPYLFSIACFAILGPPRRAEGVRWDEDVEAVREKSTDSSIVLKLLDGSDFRCVGKL